MSSKGKSIFHTILLSMLLVLGIEFILLFVTLYLTHVREQLNNNAADVLHKQVENRSGYLVNTMLKNQDLEALAQSIQASMLTLESEGKISLATLDTSSEHALPLLQEISTDLIAQLRRKNVTGIFVVLNTHDLEETAPGTCLPGLYIRDLDPDSAPSDRNYDLLLERASALVVRSMGISTDKKWSPVFRYDGADSASFYYPVFQAAFKDGGKLNASDYGRWTTSPYTLEGDDLSCIAYSIPLLLPDGTVYGVLGVEMLTSYLQTLLPAQELQDDNTGSYLLGSTRSNLLNPIFSMSVVCCSASGNEKPETTSFLLPLQYSGSDSYFTVQNGTNYYVALEPLTLYSKNAPFSSDHWVLIGTVDESHLYALSTHVLHLFWLSILLTLTVGLLCSLFVSRHLARPVAKLSAEVAQAQSKRDTIPSLSHTGIREVDQFSDAITQLSRDVLTSSTKFLRIMDMASIELGGYEIRFDTGTVFVTDNFFPMLGLSQPDTASLTPDTFRALLKNFGQCCPCTITPSGDEVYKVTPADGQVHYLRLKTTHEVLAQVGLVEDVTASTLERLRIEHDRDYDTLTGLYNRQAFQRECEALFLHPENLRHAAFLMLDLDNLKHTNDTYGHDYGDQYIRQTGLCFARHTPEGTLCSRISGDEFNVFFYGYDSQDEIRTVIEQLRDEFSKKMIHLPDGQELFISISGGIAWYPEDASDPTTLKKYADFAMYQVKHSKKGRLGEFDLGTYNNEIYSLQSKKEFDRLIREELLYYHFQPIVSCVTGEAIAYEALMRVNLPTISSPDTVLKMARAEGRLHDIERITIFKASEAYLALLRDKLVRSSDLLFLNSIASQHMTEEENREFANRFSMLQKNIVIEITEEEALDHHSLEVKRSTPGFTGMFALDDYGSGYSNDLSLLELSPLFIKIDLSIVRNIHTNPDKQQIVSNIVSYAHQRNMRIIAEGLETPEELSKVLELGVDYLQGYFLARPAAIPPQINETAVRMIRDFQTAKTV